MFTPHAACIVTPLTRVLETCLYAEDLDAARHFYEHVLGLRLHSMRAGRHLFFHCGQNMVLIFNPAATEQCEPDGVPCHGSRGPGHIAWKMTRDELAVWRTRLAEKRVPIEHEETWPNGAHSIYFRDPAGNSLEFANGSLWANDPDD